jgi:hypothetical protein
MSRFRKASLIGLVSQAFVFLLLLSERKISLTMLSIVYYVFAPGFIVTTYLYEWLYPTAEMLFTPFLWFLVGFLQGEERLFFLLSWLLNWFYYSSIAYLILSISKKRRLRMK